MDAICYTMLCYAAAIFLRMRSSNQNGGKGQITWIADLWFVVGQAIILIDLVAPLMYVISIVYLLLSSVCICDS